MAPKKIRYEVQDVGWKTPMYVMGRRVAVGDVILLFKEQADGTSFLKALDPVPEAPVIERRPSTIQPAVAAPPPQTRRPGGGMAFNLASGMARERTQEVVAAPVVEPAPPAPAEQTEAPGS